MKKVGKKDKEVTGVIFDCVEEGKTCEEDGCKNADGVDEEVCNECCEGNEKCSALIDDLGNGNGCVVVVPVTKLVMLFTMLIATLF